MAAIRETLTLEDAFSANFTRYIALGQQAAGASDLASTAARNYQSVANSLDRKLISLNAQFAVLAQEQQAMVAAGRQNTTAFSTLDAKVERLGGTIRETQAQYDAVVSQMERAQAEAKKAASATEELSQSQKRATSSSNALGGSLKSLIGTYISLQTLKGLFTMSDTLALTTARLNMMNDGLQTTAQLNAMLYQSARNTNSSYAETADFVTKLGLLAGNAFNSSQEIIAFSELINKQIQLSGATAQGAQAAMLQLSQGMSSGMLRGEELNSVLEQTPMIAQTIADYLGVSIGQLREMASEGLVTSQVVKNAMFWAADEINEKYGELPVTWRGIWHQIYDQGTMALQPLFDALNQLANSQFVQDVVNGITVALAILGTVAQIVADNIEVIGPILATAAAAWLAYKVAVTLVTIAQNLLNAAMAANPIGLIIVLIVALVAAFVWLWDNVEAFRNYWIESTSASAESWLWFYNDVVVPVGNDIITLLNQTGAVIQDFAELVVNAFADAAQFLVKNFQFVADNAKGFMNWYNAIAGALGWKQINVDFAVSPEGIEAARQSALASISKWGIEGGIQELKPIDEEQYLKNLQMLKEEAENFRISDFISQKLAEFAEAVTKGQEELGGEDDNGGTDYSKYVDDFANALSTLNDISDSVNSIDKTVSMSDEDIKSLVDMAERKYVTNVNLTSRTPVINIHGANTGNTEADRQALADAIDRVLTEQMAYTAFRATAVPT